MGRRIETYFTMASPWAYLGHELQRTIAGRHGAEISYHAVDLEAVFAETGGLALPKRHPVRQDYRLIELQRWRAGRGVDLDLWPRHWPFPPGLANKMVHAIIAADLDPAGYIGLGMHAVWAGEANLALSETLAAIADQAGLPGRDLVAAARSDDIAEKYQTETRAAIAGGYFGSPTYVVDGEIFWGQDRLELLEEMLRDERPAYQLPDRTRVGTSAGLH